MPRTLFMLIAASTALLPAACSTAPKGEESRADLAGQVSATIGRFKAADPSVQPALDSSVGYAVLPNVGKGAVVIGAAYGRGEVFQGGGKIGYCDMSQGTVGAQLGGQRYSELLIFTTRDALDNFKTGEYTLAANASAVAAEAGSTRTRDTGDGVMVYITDEKGLMAEASVGGQKFRFTPLSSVTGSATP
jgi:lipid-binding SYLF domain-containing protein